MAIRRLVKEDVEKEPFRIWNAYVNLLAMEDYNDLTEVQRPAHLVFWYESDVQNGGHFQYFENRGVEFLKETVDALGLLNANCQQQVLKDAGKLWLSRSREPVRSAQEFCEAALEGEFDDFDSHFHTCSPDLEECLKNYLVCHESSFVIFT